MTKNCKKGKACGKGCIPLNRQCHKALSPASTCSPCQKNKKTKKQSKPRKTPKCKEGVSHLCGKACVSLKKNCKRTGYKAPARRSTRSEIHSERCALDLKNAQKDAKEREQLAKEFMEANTKANSECRRCNASESGTI